MNLIWANIKRTAKDKALLIGIFSLPILAVIILSVMTSGGISNIQPVLLGVTDNSKSELSEIFIDYLAGNPNFTVSVYEEETGKKDFYEHRISSLVIVPEGFFEKTLQGDFQTLQLLRSKGIPADLINGYIDESVRKTLKGEMINSLDRSEKPEEDKGNNYFSLEVSRKTPQENATLLIGIIITLMMYSTIFLSFEINNIRQKKLLFRFYSTPNRPDSITGAILLSVFIWFCLQAAVLFTISSFFMKRPLIEHSFITAGILIASFIILNLSLGILLARVCRNSTLIPAFVNLIILPTGMISGTFVPREFLPGFIEPLSVLAPQHWFMEGIDKINSGAGFVAVIPDILILLLFAFCFFSAGIFRFKNLINT